MKIAGENKNGGENPILRLLKSKKGKFALGGTIICLALLVVGLSVVLNYVSNNGPSVQEDGDDAQYVDNREEGSTMVKDVSDMVKIAEDAGVEIDVDPGLTEEEQREQVLQKIKESNKVVTNTYSSWISSDIPMDEDYLKEDVLQQLQAQKEWIEDYAIGWRYYIETYQDMEWDESQWTDRIENYGDLVEMMRTGVLRGENRVNKPLEEQAAAIRYFVANLGYWPQGFEQEYQRYYDTLFYWFKQGCPTPDSLGTVVITELNPRLVYDDDRTASVKATFVQDDGTVYEAYLAPVSGHTYMNGKSKEDTYLLCDFYQVSTNGDILDVAVAESENGG